MLLFLTQMLDKECNASYHLQPPNEHEWIRLQIEIELLTLWQL